MAVTQQLARTSAAQLFACRQSIAELERICSRQPNDCLDLDWASAPLVRVADLANLDDAHFSALRRALDGDTEISATPEYYSPVTALEPVAVTEVAAALLEIDAQAVVAALPSDADAVSAVMGEKVDGDAHQYLTHYFAVLKKFYEEAARRNLAMVLWWD